MADKDLVERFQKAFKEPEKVDAEEYQKIIEANATKAAENTERLTFLLLGLVMIFILIIQGRIKKVDLGIVEVDDPSIVLITIPILIAYIDYELIATFAKFDMLSIIHKSIVKQRHPPIHEQKLTKYFLFLPTLYEYKHHLADGTIYQMQSFLWLAEFLLITTVIPLGSEIIAFIKLFAIPNLEYSLLLKASLFITILLNSQGILTIITLFKETGDK